MNIESALRDIVALSQQEPYSTTLAVLKTVGGLLALLAAALGLGSAALNFWRGLAAASLQRRMAEADSAPSFTTHEIKTALRNYVQPDCAQADPSEEDDIRRVADVRESVMGAVDRFVEHGGERRFMLLLADTGMGKTTFCLNYYRHAWRKKKWPAAIISLGRDDALERIADIKDKRSTILLLDALDEDSQAIENGGKRIAEIMRRVSEFRSVIITCRSQFFPDDASVPSQTGVSIIAPRKAGDAPGYKFYRLYLLPFTEEQIRGYITRTFALWNATHRSAARRLVREIPELSARPMLLALIPDLIKTRSKVKELYELYSFMVDQWLLRESRWIGRDTLLEASKILAVSMYKARLGSRDRIEAQEIKRILAPHMGEPTDFHFLTARSLLNRDSSGRFKFAHRSIMEYLFVRAAIDGNGACFEVPWTNFMTQLFVSWGRSADGLSRADRAREILARDLRETGLFPLVPQLPAPAQLTPAQLGEAAVGGGRRRVSLLPAQWREHSLKFSDRGDYLLIYDLSYDLIWQVIKPEIFGNDEDALLYRIGLQEVTQRKINQGQTRLPSLAEFLSLLEAEQVLGLQVVHKGDFYWLGDQLGSRRYLVVGFRPDMGTDELLKPVELKRAGGQAIYVYEVAMRQRPGRAEMFKAQAAVVVSGNAERGWHGEKAAQDAARALR